MLIHSCWWQGQKLFHSLSHLETESGIDLGVQSCSKIFISLHLPVVIIVNANPKWERPENKAIGDKASKQAQIINRWSCVPCPTCCSLRYYCIDDLVQVVEEQLAKLKDEHHPICRVPVITSLDEEHLIVSTSSKVCLSPHPRLVYLSPHSQASVSLASFPG